MSKRMTDERLAEIDAKLLHPMWLTPGIADELLQALKAERAEVTAGYEAGWHALRQERDDLKALPRFTIRQGEVIMVTELLKAIGEQERMTDGRLFEVESEIEHDMRAGGTKSFIAHSDERNELLQALKAERAEVTAGYEAGWHALRQERDDLKTKLGAVRSRCQQLIIESDRRLDNVIWIQEAALEK